VLAAIACLTLIWPGDLDWSGDQLLLIGQALNANEAYQLAGHGMTGTRGMVYAPAPIWFYQALLAVTHRPIVLVVIHAAVMFGLTAWGVLWLANLLRMHWLFAMVILASPHAWFYGRWLWDNPFCIPLSFLLLSAWLDWRRRGSQGSLWLAIGCGLVMPAFHPMSLPLSAAVGVDLLLHVKQWKQHAIGAAVVVVAFVLAFVKYFLHLFVKYFLHFREHASRTTIGPEMTLGGWLYPFFGARPLSGWRMTDYFFTPAWVAEFLGDWWTVLAIASAVLIGVSWIGMAAITRTAIRGESGPSPLDRRTAVVLLGALAVMIVVGGLSNVPFYPHYFNGVWPLFAVFVWEGLRLVCRRGGLVPTLGGLLAMNLALSVALAIGLHVSGGTRDILGPTLGNQLQILDDMVSTPHKSVEVRVPSLNDDAIPLLARLTNRGVPPTNDRQATIELVRPESNGGKARFVVEP
jgi:hypothetical protein